MSDYFVTYNLSALAIVLQNSKVSIAMEMVTEDNVPWNMYYLETAIITPDILDAQKRFCISLTKGK